MSTSLGGESGASTDDATKAWPRYQAEYLKKRLSRAVEPWDKYNAQGNPFLLGTGPGGAPGAAFATPGAPGHAAPKGGMAPNSAAEHVYLDKVTRDYKMEADEELKHEFNLWLQGQHEANKETNNEYVNGAGKAKRLYTHRGEKYTGVGKKPLNVGDQKDGWRHTPWHNKQLTHLPGVRDYLREQEEWGAGQDMYLNMLAEFGPQDIDQAWLYFKHWVKGKPATDAVPGNFNRTSTNDKDKLDYDYDSYNLGIRSSAFTNQPTDSDKDYPSGWNAKHHGGTGRGSDPRYHYSNAPPQPYGPRMHEPYRNSTATLDANEQILGRGLYSRARDSTAEAATRAAFTPGRGYESIFGRKYSEGQAYHYPDHHQQTRTHDFTGGRPALDRSDRGYTYRHDGSTALRGRGGGDAAVAGPPGGVALPPHLVWGDKPGTVPAAGLFADLEADFADLEAEMADASPDPITGRKRDVPESSQYERSRKRGEPEAQRARTTPSGETPPVVPPPPPPPPITPVQQGRKRDVPFGDRDEPEAQRARITSLGLEEPTGDANLRVERSFEELEGDFANNLWYFQQGANYPTQRHSSPMINHWRMATYGTPAQYNALHGELRRQIEQMQSALDALNQDLREQGFAPTPDQERLRNAASRYVASARASWRVVEGWTQDDLRRHQRQMYGSRSLYGSR